MLINFLRKNISLTTIVLITLILVAANLSPEKFLTGWDNLHPEFNFELNITRSLFGAWQEYQGLGLVGGMGHISDLPRQLFLLLSSVFFPTNLIRQVFVFLCLLLGATGAYFLCKNIVGGGKSELASLFAALFYELNISTILNFYAPFSPFIVHFALLPWLFLSIFKLQENWNKKNLFVFLVVNLLASSQGYAPTIFLVYLLSVVSLIPIRLFNVKKLVVVISAILIINSYWLLPWGYFVVSRSSTPILAKTNQMSTEKTFLQNQQFGKLSDVLFLKGFWLDNKDLVQNERWDFMNPVWRNHWQDPATLAVGGIFLLLAILGIISVIKFPSRKKTYILLLGIIGLTILANATFPFSIIDSVFYKFPLVSQVLRNPYTKFSTLYSLSHSMFVGLGIFAVLKMFSKHSFAPYVMTTSLILSFAFYSYPVFQGNLFYKNLITKIPQEYVSLFDFFAQQNPSERIANFPVQSYWGWSHASWGYDGSGFLWHGIKQPILDRNFDTWSSKNENYSWEISYALYSKNLPLLEKILEKYQVNWILLDENVINPSSPRALYYPELEEIFARSDKIKLSRQFGKIKIYKVRLNTPVKDFVFLADNLPEVGSNYNWSNLDTAFLELGHYADNTEDRYANSRNCQACLTTNFYLYPFRSLFTGKNQENLEFSLKDTSKTLTFISPPLSPVQEALLQKLSTSPVRDEIIGLDNNGKEISVRPQVNRDGNQIKVTFPKLPVAVERINPANLSIPLPRLSHRFSYLVKVKSRNVSGLPLLFWIENSASQRADLETYLPKSNFNWSKLDSNSYYVLPPMSPDGLGYTLHFDNVSLGSEVSVNELGEIEIFPIPYRFLTSLKLISSDSQLQISNFKLQIASVSHPNPSFYKISIKANPSEIHGNSSLALSQSFDPGWLAISASQNTGYRLLATHFLVDNWSNGWELSGDEQVIYLFFWPQLLEFAGLVLLATLTLYIILVPQISQVPKSKRFQVTQ